MQELLTIENEISNIKKSDILDRGNIVSMNRYTLTHIRGTSTDG